MSLPLTREPLFGVAGVQMSVSSIDDNVDRIGAYLRHIRARFPWVHLVMFSELAPLGPKLAKAEPLPGPTETRLAALARETGLWLIPGSMFEKVGGRILWQGRADSVVIGGDADDWDAVILVEYPSRKAFIDMTSSPKYEEVSKDRTAGLADSRLIAMTQLYRETGD